MIEQLWMHTGGGISDKQFPVDDPWHYNIRVQVFCKNQEELDYLTSLNLMHGREVQIDIFEEWMQIRRDVSLGNGRPLRVLPIAYTTWHVNLRGL